MISEFVLGACCLVILNAEIYFCSHLSRKMQEIDLAIKKIILLLCWLSLHCEFQLTGFPQKYRVK